MQGFQGFPGGGAMNPESWTDTIIKQLTSVFMQVKYQTYVNDTKSSVIDFISALVKY
jgi:hypothetical protein